MSNCSQTWLRAFIALAFSFGFRRGELLNLKVRNVDFFGGWLELEQGETKNGESRKVKLTGETFTLSKACATGKDPDDFPLTREDGTNVADMRDDWQSLAVACGLGKFVPAKRANGKPYEKYAGMTPHDFRRSAIRQMTRRGVSETIAMKISGHKTASVFRRYDITAELDLEEATRKIEAGKGSKTDTKTDTSAETPRSTASELPRM